MICTSKRNYIDKIQFFSFPSINVSYIIYYCIHLILLLLLCFYGIAYDD